MVLTNWPSPVRAWWVSPRRIDVHTAIAAFESPSTGPRNRGITTAWSSGTLKSALSSGSIQNRA